MDRFVHRENLRHYKRLLELTTDEAGRQRILTLLAEEESKTSITRPCPACPNSMQINRIQQMKTKLGHFELSIFVCDKCNRIVLEQGEEIKDTAAE